MHRVFEILSRVVPSLAIVGVFVVPPAIAGSMSGGVQGSASNSNASSIAASQSHTAVYDRQDYSKRNWNYSYHSFASSNNAVSKVKKHTPTNPRKYGSRSHGAAHITTYTWGINKDHLVKTKTSYK